MIIIYTLPIHKIPSDQNKNKTIPCPLSQKSYSFMNDIHVLQKNYCWWIIVHVIKKLLEIQDFCSWWRMNNWGRYSIILYIRHQLLSLSYVINFTVRILPNIVLKYLIREFLISHESLTHLIWYHFICSIYIL